jgi:hypothetical protein
MHDLVLSHSLTCKDELVPAALHEKSKDQLAFAGKLLL